MEVTLLTKDQVCGENALDVMKDDDLRKASLSDLALLLGGCQIFDNKSGDSKYTGWYWVNSVNENGLNEKMCGCIACSGEYMLAIPRSRTDSIRPVLSPKVTASLKPRAVKNGGVLK
ncbi:MAG: hypothetical protein J6X42_03170, partial [Alphaproteobacteria bacterium]|nr:hypothetical protein [Alphaproteobacteria bacterium]